jgi:hypothetical protein
MHPSTSLRVRFVKTSGERRRTERARRTEITYELLNNIHGGSLLYRKHRSRELSVQKNGSIMQVNEAGSERN